jgi:hypothetical protein
LGVRFQRIQEASDLGGDELAHGQSAAALARRIEAERNAARAA